MRVESIRGTVYELFVFRKKELENGYARGPTNWCVLISNHTEHEGTQRPVEKSFLRALCGLRG
jgi:hypothetical protein